MILGDSRRYLTYCLNVHPGESLADCRRAIERYALQVRESVAPGEKFGLGLRLGAAAAGELSEAGRLAEFKSFLIANNLFVFTVNGFPYGNFHTAPVKERVYAPDWRMAERVAYTRQLALILAELLPPGIEGSISSVPVSYRKWITCDTDSRIAADNLLECGRFLAELEQRRGCRIMLALEPEPDCLLDDTDSTLSFFNRTLADRAVRNGVGFDWRRYIGVCLDTCHAAVVFESPLAMLRTLRKHNVPVPKVQLSAALRASCGGDTAAGLARYADEVYLHQTRIRETDGSVRRFPDLTAAALESVSRTAGEVRVHLHVPLYFEKCGPLESTAANLDKEFFDECSAAGIKQFEIETYTFNILPQELTSGSLTAGIIREYAVALRLLR